MTRRDGDLLVDGEGDAAATLILAHGAGAPMDSTFMNVVARGIAAAGFRVARFEFPYMAARRHGGKRGTPDREPVLRKSWLEVVERLRPSSKRLALGGKSMGGRYATMVADEARADGVVVFGYPFHPPGQPAKLRTAHLESLAAPTLILQGERDTFGTREDVQAYTLSPSVRVHFLAGGDHSLKPSKASGRTEKDNLEEAVRLAAEFLGSLR